MDDFTIFVPMMVQKNIELQQQALMLIIQTTGSLPDSLQEGESKSQQQAASGAPLDDDEEIMKKILAYVYQLNNGNQKTNKYFGKQRNTANREDSDQTASSEAV